MSDWCPQLDPRSWPVILLAWWRSGCKLLPDTDAGLMAVARCCSRRWYQVREKVREALSETLPELQVMHTRMVRSAQLRSAIARNAGAASAAARKRRVAQSVGPKHLTDSLQSLLVQPTPQRPSGPALMRSSLSPGGPVTHRRTFLD